MTQDQQTAQTISPLDALRWHVEMGLDEVVDEMPVDRYATAQQPHRATPATAPAIQPPQDTPQAEPRQASGQALAPAEGAREAIAIAAGAVIPFLAPILVTPLGTVGAVIYVTLNAAATIALVVAAVMGWIAIAARKDRSIVLLVVTIIATVLSVLSLPALF